jgi:hypothetical protein
MWIFNKSKAINTDNVLEIWVDGAHINFLSTDGTRVSIYMPNDNYAIRLYKDIVNELGRGAQLIFNVDRRIELCNKEYEDFMKAKKE